MGNQPEGKLSAKIKAMMIRRGAFVWKVHGNEFTPTGLPDLCGVYLGQFIGCESKMPGNDLSDIQKYRIGKMRMAGALIIAPCFSVAEAEEFMDAVQAFIEGTGTAERPSLYAMREYGRGY